MDSQSIIVWAIPIFIIFMIGEMIVSDRLGERAYDLGDTISNLICGMGSQLFGLFFILIQIYTYEILLEYKFFNWDGQPAIAWILTFVAFDFQYYWFHRLSHEWNGLWVFHVVHHQSERYNFSVALRQSWFGGMFSWLFYCPLALLGFPLHIFLSCQALNLVYQYFIHTELVGNLGVLEKVLNTPSHHRVHHGTDETYIDKNYGGVFILWDRLFNSFQIEESKVHFGILSPLMSWNALKANVNPLTQLLRQIKGAANFKEIFGYLFKNPGWQEGDSDRHSAVKRSLSAKQPKLSKFNVGFAPATFAILTTVLLIITTSYILAIKESLSLTASISLIIPLIISFYFLGTWIDRKTGSD